MKETVRLIAKTGMLVRLPPSATAMARRRLYLRNAAEVAMWLGFFGWIIFAAVLYDGCTR